MIEDNANTPIIFKILEEIQELSNINHLSALNGKEIKKY